MADINILRNIFGLRVDDAVLTEVAAVSQSTEEATDRLLELGFGGDSGKHDAVVQRMDARGEILRVEQKAKVPVELFAPHVVVPPPIGVDEQLERVSERVALCVDDRATQRVADLHGLVVEPVSMEDLARNANSAFGPCVSDLTLVVRERLLPLIRTPNFTGRFVCFLFLSFSSFSYPIHRPIV